MLTGYRITHVGDMTIESTLFQENLSKHHRKRRMVKAVRPIEFRLVVAFLFGGLFIALAVTLPVLFHKSQPNGEYAQQHSNYISPG